MAANSNMDKLIEQKDKEVLGQELMSWRLRQGRTQKYVADALKMSRWTVMRLERDSKNVSEKVAYRCWAFLVLELRKEALANGQIEKYEVEKITQIGRLRIDEANRANNPADWKLENEDQEGGANE